MRRLAGLKYFCYLLLIIGSVWLRNFAEALFKRQANITFTFSPQLYAAVGLTTIIIGVAIGLEAFVKEMQKKGSWRVNLPKLFIVIPSLVISLYHPITMLNIKPINQIFLSVYLSASNGDTFISIFQIILGYSLITLMYKEEVCNSGNAGSETVSKVELKSSCEIEE